MKANDAVFEHRVGKLVGDAEDRLVTLERNRVKKQQSRNQIDRLVEDLIQERMANGEFDNLAGKGKPLPNRVDYNPYTDFTTHKVNQILVETGFAPEWVTLQKEIRDQVECVRKELRDARQKLGPAPVAKQDWDSWQKLNENLASSNVKEINKSVNKFNLIVPSLKNQKFHFNLVKESELIFNTSYNPTVKAPEVKAASCSKQNEKENQNSIFKDLINSLFTVSTLSEIMKKK